MDVVQVEVVPVEVVPVAVVQVEVVPVEVVPVEVVPVEVVPVEVVSANEDAENNQDRMTIVVLIRVVWIIYFFIEKSYKNNKGALLSPLIYFLQVLSHYLHIKFT